MNTLAAAALFLTLLAAGCGDADPKSLIPDGHSSLGSGDAQAALEHFQTALAQLEAGDPDYVEAKLGEIEALIAVDATKSKTEFLALATALPDRIGARQFLDIGGKLANGNRYSEAIDVTQAGIERFGKQAPKLKEQIVHLTQQSQSAGDDEAIGKLKGLGYIK